MLNESFKTKLHTLLLKLWGPCTELFLLVLAFFTSLSIAPLFQLPFSNPHNISGHIFNPAGFNPSSNYTTLVFIIFATLLLFVVFRRLYATKYAWVIKVVVVALLIVNHFFFNMLHIADGYPYEVIYANGPGSLDNFHSGEQLSPAQAFLSGTSLYDNIFYLRGAGVDVLIPALGFKLFGMTIGSFLLTNHILMLSTMIGFFGLVALVVKGTLKYVAAITLFYVSNAINLVQIRDIPVWIVMGCLLLLFKKDLPLLQKRVLLITIGLLSGLELYIAIDRGILLLALALMVALALVVFKADKENLYSFNLKLWKENLQSSLIATAGLLLGIGIPALFLGWSSFAAFLKMTFIEIPDYGTLLVSTQFPPLFSPGYIIWGPVIVLIAAGYLLLTLYKIKLAQRLNFLIPYALLFIFAILCLKAGANRVHELKMVTVAAPIFFIGFILLIAALSIAYKNRNTRAQLVAPVAVMLLTLGIFAQFDFGKLLQQPSYARPDIKQYLKLPSTADDFWLKEDTKQVKDYILAHTTANDYIFALPANPAYYYITNRKNPSRFYESWFADPQPYTNELLAALKRNQPKLVVYEDGSWMDAPDGVSMKQRIPEVAEWLVKNYPVKTTVGKAIVLSK